MAETNYNDIYEVAKKLKEATGAPMDVCIDAYDKAIEYIESQKEHS